MNLRQQFLTKNDCYKAGRTITPKGVMVHSTGANNPKVSRYVPGDAVMGYNTAGNHWDRSGLTKCVHAFVGKFADGSVGTVQTLPWIRQGWHAGGAANNTHIGFEICEDGLTDASYFSAVYREAVELTAMLCKEYGLDPLADGVIICHQEGYRRGVASNHADVLHWFPKQGKSMDDFRADVAREIEGDELTEEQVRTIVRDEWAKMEAERAALPASMPDHVTQAVALGISADGSRPQALLTREEGMVMAKAAYLAAVKAE